MADSSIHARRRAENQNASTLENAPEKASFHEIHSSVNEIHRPMSAQDLEMAAKDAARMKRVGEVGRFTNAARDVRDDVMSCIFKLTTRSGYRKLVLFIVLFLAGIGFWSILNVDVSFDDGWRVDYPDRVKEFSHMRRDLTKKFADAKWRSENSQLVNRLVSRGFPILRSGTWNCGKTRSSLLLLDRLVALFSSRSISYFSYGGTLLGAVRHGTFVPWDSVISLLLDERDSDRLLRMEKEFLHNGMVLRFNAKDRLHMRDKYSCERDLTTVKLANPKDGDERWATVVLRFYRKSKKNRLIALKCKDGFQNKVKALNLWTDDVFPLRKVFFGGMLIAAPARPEEILKGMYGADYMNECIAPLRDYARGLRLDGSQEVGAVPCDVLRKTGKFAFLENTRLRGHNVKGAKEIAEQWLKRAQTDLQKSAGCTSTIAHKIAFINVHRVVVGKSIVHRFTEVATEVDSTLNIDVKSGKDQNIRQKFPRPGRAGVGGSRVSFPERRATCVHLYVEALEPVTHEKFHASNAYYFLHKRKDWKKHEPLQRYPSAFLDRSNELKKDPSYTLWSVGCLSHVTSYRSHLEDALMERWKRAIETLQRGLRYHEVAKVTVSVTLFFVRLLERFGTITWVTRGSLLSTVRNGNLLPWDYDIDVGLEKNDFDTLMRRRNDVVRFMNMIAPDLLGDVVFSMNEDYLYMHNANVESWFDLTGPFYYNRTHVYHVKPEKAALTGEFTSMTDESAFGRQTWDRSWVLPLGTCEWMGDFVPCPRDPIKFIERIYNKGAVRDPDFPPLWTEVQKQEYRDSMYARFPLFSEEYSQEKTGCNLGIPVQHSQIPEMYDLPSELWAKIVRYLSKFPRP